MGNWRCLLRKLVWIISELSTLSFEWVSICELENSLLFQEVFKLNYEVFERATCEPLSFYVIRLYHLYEGKLEKEGFRGWK